MCARSATMIATLVTAALVLPGHAAAQPSSDDLTHCTGNAKEQVCLHVWSEKGTARAQPSGPWDFFTVDSTDAEGAIRRETADTERVSAEPHIRVVILGRSRAYTVSARGTTQTWFGLSSRHSVKITVTFVNR
ncbi:hypothetical protein [Nocardia sp. XZ_19_369]|uniref:hypothetical protein n=1 Tax=Nocardia sp. XZ_19_369 TaxID=2769487 RepID=UPI00188FAEA8|nr:hypothetical protein [Nocardia sp. XZ_19_369]